MPVWNFTGLRQYEGRSVEGEKKESTGYRIEVPMILSQPKRIKERLEALSFQGEVGALRPFTERRQKKELAV